MSTIRPLIYPVLTILAFFIILFAYIKLAGPIPFSINSIVTNKSETFAVSGVGEVQTSPDSASIRVGVTTNAPTVKAAQEGLNQNINTISENIKKLGVKNEDIKTENYNVYPQQDFREGNLGKITGYTANANLLIKVREIDKANDVIDTATSSGANQVSGVTFEVSDKTKAENEARQKAVADAKSKAEQAAKVVGFKLGKLINYNENFEGQEIPYGRGAALEVAKEAIPTQLEPGSNTIRVRVYLNYEIF